ncbi:MAG: TetR/AcrR family transcriptional regulator [Chloroflexi bacterium]|nr:MAG: TetR/AcrR family transcriptional regulator [Chloroflexota bacterium]
MSKSAELSDKARATRERILDAAVNVFSRKGYHATKVDDIVGESETSKGSVYFHFPGKQQIFLALVDKFADMLQRRVAEAVAQETDSVQRVNLALQVCLQTFAQYRSLAKIFLVQAVGLGTVFEEKRLELHDRFAGLIREYLDQAVAAGDIAPVDTEMVAYAWMGAINEVVIRWVYTGQPTPDRLMGSLREILLRSVGVPEERIRQSEPALSAELV